MKIVKKFLNFVKKSDEIQVLGKQPLNLDFFAKISLYSLLKFPKTNLKFPKNFLPFPETCQST